MESKLSVLRKNGYFLLPDTHTCVSGGKKCPFFRKFNVLCFLETPVLRFALLPYYRRNFFNSVAHIKNISKQKATKQIILSVEKIKNPRR